MQVKSNKEKQLEMIVAKSQEKVQQTYHYSHNDIELGPRYSFPHIPYPSINHKPSQTNPKPKPQSMNRKLGQMSNKRKGKQSILQSGDKKMMQLISNWYLEVGKEEKYLSGDDLKKRSDFWTGFYLRQKQHDNAQKVSARGEIIEKRGNTRQDEITTNNYNYYYENDSECPQNLQSILTRTYPIPSDIQCLFYYDQHPVNSFSIQHPISNLLQSRLIFQAWHHTKLQSEFYRISQIVAQNQNKVDKLKHKQKKQADGYGIGFRKADRAEERKTLERFVKEGFDEEYLPEVVKWETIDDMEQEDMFGKTQQQQAQSQIIDKGRVYDKLAQFSSSNHATKNTEHKGASKGYKKKETSKETHEKQSAVNEQSSTSSKHQTQSLSPSNKQKQQSSSSLFQQSPQKPSSLIQLSPSFDPTLLSSLIQCYFTNIQTKYSRLAKDQKTHRIYYFPSIDTSNWDRVCGQFRDVQRVFVVVEQPGVCLVRMEKLYNMHKEMIKCVVYMFGNSGMQEVQREFLKKKVGASLNNQYMVTFSFKPTTTTTSQTHTQSPQQSKLLFKLSTLNHLPCKNLLQVQYLIGMLTVLIYEQKLQESSYEPADFLSKGQQLIKEYQLFFSQDKQNLVLTYNEFFKLDHNYYQKLAKINYIFDIQNDDGLAFDKLSAAVLNKQQQDKVEVFKARTKKHKNKLDGQDSQEAAIEEDQDQQSENDEENQQGDYGRPMFIPMNREDLDNNGEEQYRTQGLVKANASRSKDKPLTTQQILISSSNGKDHNQAQIKEKQKQKDKKLLQARQLRPLQLILDQHKPISNDNRDGIKRSNSRQQLKNINIHNLLDLNHHYYDQSHNNQHQVNQQNLNSSKNTYTVYTEINDQTQTNHQEPNRESYDQQQYEDDYDDHIGL